MRFRPTRLLCFLTLLGIFAISASAAPASAVSDSAYLAHHPVLMFTSDELPAIRAKIDDGGNDAFAYTYIRDLVENTYPTESDSVFLADNYFGVVDIQNLGLAAHIEDPPDLASMDRGRSVTLALAQIWDVDDDTFFSSLRLRTLAFGYDMFFASASPEDRGRVVSEMELYIDWMLDAHRYELWKHRPYLSNISTMIGSALGLAAICLDGETDPQRVERALAAADEYFRVWLEYQLDPQGAYKEGVMYATWSMRHLVSYFEARQRYDGVDYSTNSAIRNIEKWLAHEMIPVGRAQMNNLNDSAALNFPAARHNAYLDWAQTAWGSGLSRWLWLEVADPENAYDWGRLRNAAATVLWSRDIAPVSPNEVLPTHYLWDDRGLYYFRTGWPEGGVSDDMVFHFYSGKFHGGHSQEDQNSFTLYANGARLAIDHGFTGVDSESEAHNITFVDGKGQHHSRGSVGTDGRITNSLLGESFDLVAGDATSAYTTYSEFNEPGVPFPDSDWSYGYDGGNPVEYATREFIVAHGPETPPYLVLVEDIKKDEVVHRYDWRMHTDEANRLIVSQNPIIIESQRGHLQIHVADPAFETLTITESAFDNQHDDPDAKILVMSVDAVAPRFFMAMLPLQTEQPVVESERFSWGSIIIVRWTAGLYDIIVSNETNEGITVTAEGHDIMTDADLALLRFSNGVLESELCTGVTELAVGGQRYVDIEGEPISVTVGGNSVVLNRSDASFRIHAPDATEVRFRDQVITTHRDGAYVVSGSGGGAKTPSVPITLTASPVPFNTVVNITVSVRDGGPVRVAVYDAAGRLVATLVDRSLTPGTHPLSWDGRGRTSARVSSGVYFIRAQTSAGATSRKIVLVR